MPNVLIADDDKFSRILLEKIVQKIGYTTDSVEDGKSALEALKGTKYDILLTDFNMPAMNGIELTRRALELDNSILVILITAYGSIKQAVEAIKLGAYDYLTKPVNNDELQLIMKRGLETLSLLKEVILLRQQLDSIEGHFDFITESNAVRKILDEAKKTSNSDSIILITGEGGSGKEHLARYIHHNSNRAKEQFVVVNCSSVSKEELESNLFGVSDTGEGVAKLGYLEIAENGTIFLDDITSVDLALQYTLVRVLQSRKFSRVNENKVQTTNARIIAATSNDIPSLISKGLFREDLYYIMNVFEYNLLPLRNRPEDIILYFNKFIQNYTNLYGKRIREISSEVRAALLNYDWPGNVRELKNIAERVSILAENEKITPDLLPDKMFIKEEKSKVLLTNDFNENKREVVREFERKFLTKFLKLFRGNISATAREINFHPVTLRQKLIDLGINPKEFKKKLN
ncbi:MAG: transcriptional regulatory protein pilR [Chlorobi bacterium OLB4]|jgi:Response regulator containing CheY-like receiver, AAA-type ATPase, and DNA-binding domains|nr:MAG: transcriptional regulatory protein pilR [Chlorobi bacterium OLB4]MBW7855017.1 sigma-54-dependent Fis family transcriptional regulator [Ignavibacteria bacterium]OQY76798.1 MAG: hypothetical protein B6D43_09220 [Ignavibacteriales bacterium UTCHB1]